MWKTWDVTKKEPKYIDLVVNGGMMLWFSCRGRMLKKNELRHLISRS